MTNSRTRALYLATAALALPLAAPPALAQDGAQEERQGGVGEIVVTAQRQAQSVLEVPLSIQAMSGDQLANAGIRQLSDMQFTTPGLTPSNSSGYNQMFIRGVGNSIFVGADPSVATFIDDVPRVFGTLVNNFVDVERVEVIKGAPGALYGRNATGGAVNIITRQPSTDAFSGKLRMAYGMKKTFQASAFLNVPLGENAAWTIAGERRSHDPYIKNVRRDPAPYTAAMFPGGSFLGTAAQTAAVMNSGISTRKGYSDENFSAVSTKLKFEASDNFKITFAGDWSKKNDDNGNGFYNVDPLWPVGSLAFFMNSYIGSSTTPALLAPLAVTRKGKFTTAQAGVGHVKLRDWGVSATAVLSLPGLDLTSISAYRKNKSGFLTELGFTPFNFLAASVDLKKSTTYQELRAVSTGDGPFSYIVGASYLRATLEGGMKTNLLFPVPYLQGLPAGQGGYVVKNWSAYAQGSYDFTENVNLMLSGRYIHEKNNAHSFNAALGRDDLVGKTEKKFLPAATLSYKLDGGGNLYARWARGFKAGGIVPVTPISVFPDPETQGGIFKGESIDTYEAGIRTPLMDRNLQLTAAVFYNDYKDVQFAAHARLAYQALVSIAVVNAGSARTYGAEIGLVAKVAEPLTLNASAAYLNAKYKRLSIANNPVLEDFNLNGTRMLNSPKWQFAFGADLDQPMDDGWRMIGNVTGAYTTKTLWQQSGLPGVLPDVYGPKYLLVNARMGARSADESWEFAIYAKNVFNKEYTTFGGSTAAYGNIFGYGDPRIVGAEVSYKF
mgnify:CR=1 FL=1